MTAPSSPAGDVAKLVERAQSRADASFWPDGRPHHFNYTTQDADLDRGLATALESLSRDLATAQARIATLEVALGWYADPISYAVTQTREPRSAVHGDNGSRARSVLSTQPKETPDVA